jgi:hypothetical protein
MWTGAHRARHEARLKEMVTRSAVGGIARWLERADPPRSLRRTPLLVREQGVLVEVLTEMREHLPFAVLGFDTATTACS